MKPSLWLAVLVIWPPEDSWRSSAAKRRPNFDMGCDCGIQVETAAVKSECAKSAMLESHDQVRESSSEKKRFRE